jgi:hypothetical protein
MMVDLAVRQHRRVEPFARVEQGLHAQPEDVRKNTALKFFEKDVRHRISCDHDIRDRVLQPRERHVGKLDLLYHHRLLRFRGNYIRLRSIAYCERSAMILTKSSVTIVVAESAALGSKGER